MGLGAGVSTARDLDELDVVTHRLDPLHERRTRGSNAPRNAELRASERSSSLRSDRAPCTSEASPRGEARGLFLRRLEHRLTVSTVSFRGHLVEDAGELALLVDDEGRADDAHELPAVERLLAPHAPRLGDRVVVSASSGNPSPYLSSNFFCFSTGSGLMPTTAAFSFFSCGNASRRLHDCVVQPGVSAFG